MNFSMARKRGVEHRRGHNIQGFKSVSVIVKDMVYGSFTGFQVSGFDVLLATRRVRV